MICEKCWSDAYLRSYGTGKSQYECYLELLEERKDNPCQPVAQSNNASSGLAETSAEDERIENELSELGHPSRRPAIR